MTLTYRELWYWWMVLVIGGAIYSWLNNWLNLTPHQTVADRIDEVAWAAFFLGFVWLMKKLDL